MLAISTTSFLPEDQKSSVLFFFFFVCDTNHVRVLLLFLRDDNDTTTTDCIMHHGHWSFGGRKRAWVFFELSLTHGIWGNEYIYRAGFEIRMEFDIQRHTQGIRMKQVRIMLNFRQSVEWHCIYQLFQSTQVAHSKHKTKPNESDTNLHELAAHHMNLTFRY